MSYLARNVDCRADPRRLLPGAVSVICVALNYRRADGYVRPSESAARQVAAAGRTPEGRIAQYARGLDYHDVLRSMLRRLVAGVAAAVREPFAHRICVDSAPVLERELAARAGLGWIGRNCCLLCSEFGSYLLLGELVTSLELVIDEPVSQRCGTCRRCLEACPTGAFVAPGRLDATHCISYLTIEHRGHVDRGQWAGIGEWVFGCDVCQQVCPYNAAAPLGTNPDVMANRLPERVNLLSLIDMRADQIDDLVRGTAASRARAWMWKRNAGVASVNHGITSAIAHEAASDDGSEHADASVQPPTSTRRNRCV
jgi:epoxyqueuosine reductase